LRGRSFDCSAGANVWGVWWHWGGPSSALDDTSTIKSHQPSMPRPMPSWWLSAAVIRLERTLALQSMAPRRPTAISAPYHATRAWMPCSSPLQTPCTRNLHCRRGKPVVHPYSPAGCLMRVRTDASESSPIFLSYPRSKSSPRQTWSVVFLAGEVSLAHHGVNLLDE
jgi:hypothetical protein